MGLPVVWDLNTGFGVGSGVGVGTGDRVGAGEGVDAFVGVAAGCVVMVSVMTGSVVVFEELPLLQAVPENTMKAISRKKRVALKEPLHRMEAVVLKMSKPIRLLTTQQVLPASLVVIVIDFTAGITLIEDGQRLSVLGRFARSRRRLNRILLYPGICRIARRLFRQAHKNDDENGHDRNHQNKTEQHQ